MFSKITKSIDKGFFECYNVFIDNKKGGTKMNEIKKKPLKSFSFKIKILIFAVFGIEIEVSFNR